MNPFQKFEVLSFDCYGTLVDWEAGILASLGAMLRKRGLALRDDDLLALYAAIESEEEAGEYRPYRDILARSLRRVFQRCGATSSAAQERAFANSVGDWPPFADTVAALQRLRRRYKLAILSNVDDDLFARTNGRLGVAFDWIVTAEQARSYKPNARHFELARQRFFIPKERHLHVAQSLFHDIAPAKAAGIATVWINRRAGRDGFGATPPSNARPDWTFPDMKSFAEAAMDDGRSDDAAGHH